MDSTSLYNYRIKKKWKLNSSGDKEYKFYPQYHQKLFGWCYTYKYDWSSRDMGFGTLVGTVFDFFIMIGVGLWVITSPNIYNIPLFLLSVFLQWYILYIHYHMIDDDTAEYNDLNRAKKWISDRIKYIENEKRKKEKCKQNGEELPDDEVYYLDLKIERAEKLKRINRKSKWGF